MRDGLGTREMTTLMPSGHAFFSIDHFITSTGKDILEDLLDKASKRNPDLYDMYIYEDFYAHGVLDLVDKTLSTLYTKIARGDCDGAYSILEGLAVFNEIGGEWTDCHDTERAEITDKVFGALAITLLRALKEANRLNVVEFPSLECLLRTIVSWGEMTNFSEYALICKTMARRIFGSKSEADCALEQSRIVEWIENLDDVDLRRRGKMILEKIEKERAEQAHKGQQGVPWYMKGAVGDEDGNDQAFRLPEVWKEYKARLATYPKSPVHGGPIWDITKWSTAEREQFEFSADSDS